jgi:RNA polymerase sigma-70 factor (ECF subfamily)
MTTTRATLLDRVRDPRDREAWEQFFELYAPLLEGYARANGLGPADAEEVRDRCLAVVAQRMPDFEYERALGTFKAWLFRIAHGKVVDVRRRAREERAPTEALRALPSPADDPDELWERRWREEHLRFALARAREAESAAGRDAIDLLLQHAPVELVRERTQLTVHQVYKVRARLLKRVRESLARLGARE